MKSKPGCFVRGQVYWPVKLVNKVVSYVLNSPPPVPDPSSKLSYGQHLVNIGVVEPGW